MIDTSLFIYNLNGHIEVLDRGAHVRAADIGGRVFGLVVSDNVINTSC